VTRRGRAAEPDESAPTSTVASTGGAARSLLRGGSLVALLVGALGTAVSGFWGMGAATAFGVGTVLAVAALAAGPLLLRASRDAPPPAVTAIAMLGYAGVVVLLGVAFLVLGPIAWLSAEHLAAALVTVTVAGIAGQIRAVTRLRVLAFGSAQDTQVTTDRVARNRDAAQSSQQTTR
jgi:hypothetical protein